MHFRTLLPLLVGPAIGNLAPRDGKSVVASLSTITDQLATMNATLDKIQGADDAQAAVDFQNEATDLKSQLEKATDTVKSSNAFSDEESSSVAYAVLDVTDLTYTVLGKVATKHDAFDKLGGSAITDLVHDQLGGLQNTTDTFSTALTDKFVEAVKSVAPLLISSLDFHFYQTIQVYADKGGK